MSADFYPLPHHVRAIGVPYAGTHSKAFNVRGGSNNWESENAVDLPTPKGTPVYAVADGTIGPQIGALNSKQPRMAGLRLHLVTANNEFYYAHLSRLVVKAGEQVQAGQLLGYSGVANGVAHLHIAAKNGDPRDAFGVQVPASPSASPQEPTPASSAAPVPEPAPEPTPAIPPMAAPPPTALPLPVAGEASPSLPGSVTILPARTADLWQQVASQGVTSPETQLLAENAVLAAQGAA